MNTDQSIMPTNSHATTVDLLLSVLEQIEMNVRHEDGRDPVEPGTEHRSLSLAVVGSEREFNLPTFSNALMRRGLQNPITSIQVIPEIPVCSSAPQYNLLMVPMANTAEIDLASLLRDCYFSLHPNGTALFPLAVAGSPNVSSGGLAATAHLALLAGRSGFDVTFFLPEALPPEIAQRCEVLGISTKLIRGSGRSASKPNQEIGVVVCRRGTRDFPAVACRSTKRPKAMVFNNFLRTAGGGERSTLHYASALADLGYSVELATDHPVRITLDEVVAPFGIPVHPNWSLTEYPGQGALLHSVQADKFQLFLNHTYGSFSRNYAPVGLYALMFPGLIGQTEKAQIQTYSNVLCISSFVAQYARKYWGEDLETATLIPPISAVHQQGHLQCSAQKEKLILNIGRFNVFGHNKNQLEAIRAFKQLIANGILTDEWQLVVIGHVNQGPETAAYLELCRRTAEGYPITIHTDLAVDALCDYYRRAAYLWQFTGYGMRFGEDPHHCEHLGLVALDGFAYGTLPVVFCRTGMNSIIHDTKNGYVFRNFDDLSAVMRHASQVYGTAFHRLQRELAVKSFESYSYGHFKDGLERVITHAERYRMVA